MYIYNVGVCVYVCMNVSIIPFCIQDLKFMYHVGVSVWVRIYVCMYVCMCLCIYVCI